MSPRFQETHKVSADRGLEQSDLLSSTKLRLLTKHLTPFDIYRPVFLSNVMPDPTVFKLYHTAA
jgi:hypothetical protein